MLWIIAMVLMAIVAIAILSFAVHVIFSPWLLLVAVVVVLWLALRPRRARR